MRMKNPPHPGELVRDDCLVPLGLSVTAAAKWLGVSRNTMSEIVNGRAGISAEMALRLEKAGWSTAEAWVGIQADYDLAQAKRHESEIKVKRYPQPEPA